ncbi:MAG: dTMP kinase, partial [Bdellovibrionales bacterium]|nr:dTMP kinase [Bdellovibrionales bacterium]
MAFLVFEGIDGAGKSTLMNSLKEELIKKNQEVVVTREPGGTALGEELRQILLKKEGDTPVPRTELLLYEAIRAQHVERVLKPAIV